MDIQKAQLDLNTAALEWFEHHKPLRDVYEQKLGEACLGFLKVLESFEVLPAVEGTLSFQDKS